MKRRKFLVTLSALPFLGFLKPETEPVKVPGLSKIVVEAGDAARIQYGTAEPILNVWVSDNPPHTEIMWAWMDGDTNRLAYMSVVQTDYAKRCTIGDILADSLEFHNYEA